MELGTTAISHLTVNTVFLPDGIPELSSWTWPYITKTYIPKDLWDKLYVTDKPNLLNGLAYKKQAEGEILRATKYFECNNYLTSSDIF